MGKNLSGDTRGFTMDEHVKGQKGPVNQHMGINVPMVGNGREMRIHGMGSLLTL